MVVIVTNPVFEKRGRTRWLDPADQALPGQQAESIVNRLLRDRADAGADMIGDGVDRAVGEI